MSSKKLSRKRSERLQEEMSAFHILAAAVLIVHLLLIDWVLLGCLSAVKTHFMPESARSV